MDARDFERMYEAYLVPVYRYSYLRLGTKEAAEDVTQVVFEKAWAAKSEYRDMGKSPLAYLFTIARNTIIDRLRAVETVPLDPQAREFLVLPDDEHDPREATEKREAAERVYEYLSKLREEDRDVIALRYLAELKYRDIASILDKSEDAVRQMVSRALKTLHGYTRSDI